MNQMNVGNTKPLEGADYIFSWLRVLFEWISKQYLIIGNIIFLFWKKLRIHFCEPKETSLVLCLCLRK